VPTIPPWLKSSVASQLTKHSALNPCLSVAAEFVRPGDLKLVHGNYLIYYRIKEEEKIVEVLRFVNGAQIR